MCRKEGFSDTTYFDVVALLLPKKIMKKRTKSRFLALVVRRITDFQFFFTEYNALGFHGCYDTTLVALGNGIR